MTYGRVVFIGYVEKINNNTTIIALRPRYRKGLCGIEDYSHLIILYWLHKRDTKKDRDTLTVTPKRHKNAPETGVFSTRSPSRPNPVGLSVVQLIKVQGLKLLVEGFDADVGTPIIDLKPYLPRADRRFKVRTPKWVRKGPPT